MTRSRPIIATVLLGIVSPASYSEGFSRNLIGIHPSQLSSDRCYLSRTSCGRSVRRHRFLPRRWDMMGSSSSAKHTAGFPHRRDECSGSGVHRPEGRTPVNFELPTRRVG